MRLMPRSTARRRTAMASSRSSGGPQMPSPVMRMAPKPRRRTVRSPRVMVSSRVVVGMPRFYPRPPSYPSALADLGRHDRRRQEGAVGHPPQEIAGPVDTDDFEAAGPGAESAAHTHLGAGRQGGRGGRVRGEVVAHQEGVDSMDVRPEAKD